MDRENVTIDDLFKILFLTISHDYPPIALTVLPRLKPAVLDEGVANALLLMALRFSNISLLEMIWPLDSPIPKFLPSIEVRKTKNKKNFNIFQTKKKIFNIFFSIADCI